MRTTHNAVLVLLMLVGNQTFVQASEENSESWLDEIATIEAQTQLLQKRDELRSQLEKSSASTLASLPSIVSIMTMSERYQSQLYFPNGRLSYVQVGDMLAADVRVSRITPNGVEVQVGKGAAQRTVPLVFVTLNMRTTMGNDVSRETQQRNAMQDAILPEAPQVSLGNRRSSVQGE